VDNGSKRSGASFGEEQKEKSDMHQSYHKTKRGALAPRYNCAG